MKKIILFTNMSSVQKYWEASLVDNFHRVHIDNYKKLTEYLTLNNDEIMILLDELSIKDIMHNIKLDLDEVDEANRAISTLMDLGFSLNKYGLEKALKDVSSKKYNFWKHLLIIYLYCLLEYDNVDMFQTVIDESNGDLIAYAKKIFIR